MRRDFRLLPNLLVIASATLSVAAGVLWVRANRGRPPDRWSFHLGGRVSVRCDPRRITLIVPPGRGPAEDAAEGRALAGRLRNDQARWAAGFAGVTRGATAECACQNVMRQTHVEGWSWIPAAAAYGPLLAALEDPDRFVVAHHLLCQFKSLPAGLPLAEVREREVFADDDGLHVELGPPALAPSSNGKPGPVPTIRPTSPVTRSAAVIWGAAPQYALFADRDVLQAARVNRSQIPELVNQWHDRLGVQAVAVPYWLPLLAGLLLPARWWSRTARTWFRLRRGRCPRCGYDLRATPAGCPECGPADAREAIGHPGALVAPEARPTASRSCAPSDKRRRTVAFAAAALLLISGGVSTVGLLANRRHEPVTRASFAQQTARDDARLDALFARVRRAAASDDWRQPGWRDPELDAELAAIVQQAAQTSTPATLVVPVRFGDLNVHDKGDAQPNLSGELYVIAGQHAYIGYVNNSIVLADGDVEIGYADDSVVLARGAARLSHINGCVIIAGHYLRVASDGVFARSRPGWRGSLLYSGSVLTVAHADGSICRAPRGMRVSHAQGVTFMDSPLLDISGETACRRVRRVRFNVLAAPRPNPLAGTITVTASTRTDDQRARGRATAVLSATGEELALRPRAVITNARGIPVPALQGWTVSVIDRNFVLLSDGKQEAEFYPAQVLE